MHDVTSVKGFLIVAGFGAAAAVLYVVAEQKLIPYLRTKFGV